MRLGIIPTLRLPMLRALTVLVMLSALMAAIACGPETAAETLKVVPATNAQGEPVVRFYLFYSTTCPHCHEVMENYLPGVYGKYGDQLEHRDLDVLASSENLDAMLGLEEMLGVPAERQGPVPALVIGDQLLIGAGEIPAELEGLIDRYLAQGGADWPGASEPGFPMARALPTLEKPVHVVYFSKAGCQECAGATNVLSAIARRLPLVQVETLSMEETKNKLLSECLSERLGVPEKKRLSTPMVFVGNDYLIGTDATYDKILDAIAKYARSGAERTWDSCDEATASQGLVQRFGSFGVLTVLGAGLIDGLNPCAFATLVFFISYMALTGRRGRDILFVGIAFALGVFLTYLLVGLGLLTAVQKLSFFTSLGRWVYLLTALMCMVLAAFTLRDYSKARQGRHSEMTLRLPLRLRQRINKVIREGARVRAFVAMALVTGFVVSLIELACTGQVYLPTIMFVLSVPELASRAVLYLLLYCVMFIIPLIVVFVLAYLGTTSEQFGAFVNRHTASVKLATGMVFAGLAAWMTWALAPLFGIAQPWTWVLLGLVLALIAVGAFILLKTEKPVRRKPVPRRKRSRA